MTSEYQQPAFPYRADPLDTHDAGLRFAREFGTNVTTDVGDYFDSVGGQPVLPASINARLGALQISAMQNLESDSPRGQTFLLPDWALLPPSLGFGADVTLAVLYAHTAVNTSDTPSPIAITQNRVGLVLAPETFVGAQPATPFITLDARPMTGNAGLLEANAWANGATPVVVAAQNSITGVYWRVFIIAHTGKDQCELMVDASDDGLCWYQVTPAATLIADFLIRRVGLGVTGRANGLLDWVRLYQYVAQPGLYAPVPDYPLTGGRIYIP